MKKSINLLFVSMLMLIIASCSNDGDGVSPQGDNDLAAQQNATEETPIPTATLETGITINGATKEEGTPPAPNSNLNFQLNTDATEGFQRTGLEIEFSSDESIAGAYIQFKDVDGNSTDSFYDVSTSAFSNGRIGYRRNDTSKSVLGKRQNSNARIAEDFDNAIRVGFDANIPAGQFCYDICLYDASNNISQIQTVCVTVEAWGGNADIVGEWTLDRVEPDDNKDEFTCLSGEKIAVEWNQILKEEFTLVFNGEGKYNDHYIYEGRDIDRQTTIENCSVVYEDEVYKQNEKYVGNWAYNEEDQALTVISFGYEDLIDPEYNSVSEEGELYLEGYTVEIVSGQLVITDTYQNEDGSFSKFYFDRK